MMEDLKLLSSNALIDTLLNSVSGLIAILNTERQILTLNARFLHHIGIPDIKSALGLRMGEVLHCVHASEPPNGCGTTRYCRTCGAAIAMVTSLAENAPSESTCAAQIIKNGLSADIYLHIRCSPISIKGKRFIFLFIRDDTVQQQRAILEKAFLHDITNTATALQMNTQFIRTETNQDNRDKALAQIQHLTQHLIREVQIQHLLASAETANLKLAIASVSLTEVLNRLDTMLSTHPAKQNKQIDIQFPLQEVKLETDITLLLRILINMTINALEASAENHAVRIWTHLIHDHITLSVWNHQCIPSDVAMRIFQRNFTTKKEAGRGTGTFAMKLLGETYLKGAVRFTSTPEEGTTFLLELPLHYPDL